MSRRLWRRWLDVSPARSAYLGALLVSKELQCIALEGPSMSRIVNPAGTQYLAPGPSRRQLDLHAAIGCHCNAHPGICMQQDLYIRTYYGTPVKVNTDESSKPEQLK